MPGAEHGAALGDGHSERRAKHGHEQAWHDGNGHSHLQATWLGPDLTVPVREGHLVLGTWQQIFHIECDVSARSRTLIVTICGDSGG